MDRVRLQRTPPFIEPLNYECQKRPNEDDVPKGSGLAYALFSAVKSGGAVLLLQERRLPMAGPGALFGFGAVPYIRPAQNRKQISGSLKSTNPGAVPVLGGGVRRIDVGQCTIATVQAGRLNKSRR